MCVCVCVCVCVCACVCFFVAKGSPGGEVAWNLPAVLSSGQRTRPDEGEPRERVSERVCLIVYRDMCAYMYV